MKTNYQKFIFIALLAFCISSCNKNSSNTTGTCTDGVKNQGETGIDCGGPCPVCVSCSDGIKNQGETGIDCGGPCPACNYLCTGNGSASYMPLALHNKWTWTDPLGEVPVHEI